MAVSFLNSFLSYLLLLLVIVVLGAIAITVGITLRKKKNTQAAVQETVEQDIAATEE